MLHIGESIRKCNKSATITKQRVETPFFIRVSERDGGFKSLLLRSKISEKPKENQGFLVFFRLKTSATAFIFHRDLQKRVQKCNFFVSFGSGIHIGFQSGIQILVTSLRSHIRRMPEMDKAGVE